MIKSLKTDISFRISTDLATNKKFPILKIQVFFQLFAEKKDVGQKANLQHFVAQTSDDLIYAAH